MSTKAETIAMLRPGSGFLNWDSYVARTFKTASEAHRYQNGLDHNVTIRRLPGRWKKGDKVPFGVGSDPL